MRKIVIALPDGLYAELQEATAATKEPGYRPEDWASEVIASELAARRLPRFTLGGRGLRPGGAVDPVTHRVVLPHGRVLA
jgi:hypothetical protein